MCTFVHYSKTSLLRNTALTDMTRCDKTTIAIHHLHSMFSRPVRINLLSPCGQLHRAKQEPLCNANWGNEVTGRKISRQRLRKRCQRCDGEPLLRPTILHTWNMEKAFTSIRLPHKNENFYQYLRLWDVHTMYIRTCRSRVRPYRWKTNCLAERESS